MWNETKADECVLFLFRLTLADWKSGWIADKGIKTERWETKTLKWEARVPAAAPKMIDFFNIPPLCRKSANAPPVFPDYSQWKNKTEISTHMDVELHILPLAETSKFVTLGWGEREKVDLVICLQIVQWSHPPTPLSHLSMNFWKIFPLKLSQISTMYGCMGTDTQTADQAICPKTMWFAKRCEYMLLGTKGMIELELH